LRARIGRALTATHEYHRAIDFYEAILREAGVESAINTNMNSQIHTPSELVPLSHDLARLYLKLGRAESAVRVLENALHDKTYCGTSSTSESKDDSKENYGNTNKIRSNLGGADIDDMRQDVLTLLILVQVREKSEGFSTRDVSITLEQTRNCQQEIIAALRTGGGAKEVVDSERQRLSELSQRLGAWLLSVGREKEAEKELQASLESNPQNTETMLTLANLYKSRGLDDSSAVELCRSQCRKVISSDPSNEAATIILSETLFNSDEPDAAIVPLQDLLKRVPNNYHALEKLIILLRRSGRLVEVPEYIESALKNDSRAVSHSGYHFCNGLYNRYTNDPIASVTSFNQCRRDKDWGPDALVHMIELYLNPDNDAVWATDGINDGERNVDDSRAEHIAVAESLILELEPKARDKRRLAVLKNYAALATRQKSKVEEVC
jgi:tetratricopeptide (TPR) repeat protein